MGKLKATVDSKRRKSRHKSTLRALGVRSGLEEKVQKQLIDLKKDFGYETDRLQYTLPAVAHTYTPDFVLTKRDGSKLYIETKGRWLLADRLKHWAIKLQYPDLDLRFVFSDSKQRIRKGSTTSYRDICEGRGRGVWKGLMWQYADKLVPEEWLLE